MLPEQLDKLNRRSFFWGGAQQVGRWGLQQVGLWGGGLLVSNGPSLGYFLDPPLQPWLGIPKDVCKVSLFYLFALRRYRCRSKGGRQLHVPGVPKVRS